MRACALLAALLALGMSSSAFAASVTILPTASEAGVDPSIAESLQTELNRWLASHDWQVLPPGSGEAAAEACSTAECGHKAALSAGADAAAQLRIFRHPPNASFVVALYEGLEASYIGDAEGAVMDLAALIDQAMAKISTQRRRGAGPWLEVTGSPVDAAVRVDGRVVGTLPCTIRVSSGLHLVIVEHPGYTPFNTTVSLGDFSGAHRRVDAALRANGAAGTSHSRLVQPSAVDWTLGATLAAAGIGVGVLGFIHRSADGECTRREQGTCVAERAVGPRVRAEMGAGAVALLAGASLLVWAPFARNKRSTQVTMTVGPDNTGLVWRESF